METKILAEIKRIEDESKIYDDFLKDPSNSEEDKKIVAYRLFYELVAYSTYANLINYTPPAGMQLQLALGLKEATAYVKVDGGKIKISQEYRDLMKMVNPLKK